jgi:hypothetical protein
MASKTPETPKAPEAPKAPAATELVTIHPPNIQRAVFRIEGKSYVQNRFAARVQVSERMTVPQRDRKSRTARPPRNFEQDFENAHHRTVAGWCGIPCAAFRAAMIDACRTVNLVMTRAKMSLFVVPDGFDMHDGYPLVRLYSHNPPERTELPVRNDNGSLDIRVRPLWRDWWADITIEFDADMISAESVANLLDRAGRQVGVGEGRPFSKNSAGMGWGTFTVQTKAEVAA